MLCAGLSATPAFAAPYLSASAGAGMPGCWEEVGWNSHFETGLALNGAIGYTFGAKRVELSVGYQKSGYVEFPAHDATIMSCMGNGYYDFDAGSGVVPYVTGGAGVVTVERSFLQEGSTDFAWQVGAGLSVNVTKSLKLDLGYRYLRPEGLECAIDGNPVKWAIHNLLAGFRYQF